MSRRLLFMLYFGQCQILKRGQWWRDKIWCMILKTCQDAKPIKQNSASVLPQHSILHYSASTVNLLCKGATDQGLFPAHLLTAFCFSLIGGQTLLFFIRCPLKYIYSASINLNLQHCGVKHYATAALSQPPGLKRTHILHIRCDFAYDWLHVCFLTANILQDCEARIAAPPTPPPQRGWLLLTAEAEAGAREVCTLTFTKLSWIIIKSPRMD